jgi:hypothetical protein
MKTISVVTTTAEAIRRVAINPEILDRLCANFINFTINEVLYRLVDFNPPVEIKPI